MAPVASFAVSLGQCKPEPPEGKEVAPPPEIETQPVAPPEAGSAAESQG